MEALRVPHDPPPSVHRVPPPRHPALGATGWALAGFSLLAFAGGLDLTRAALALAAGRLPAVAWLGLVSEVAGFALMVVAVDALVRGVLKASG